MAYNGCYYLHSKDTDGTALFQEMDFPNILGGDLFYCIVWKKEYTFSISQKEVTLEGLLGPLANWRATV